MMNFPTYEHFDALAADAALEQYVPGIEAAVRAAFPGARFVCAPSSIRLGPPPYGLDLWFTFGASREEYANGIDRNDPLYHRGSVVPLRDGTGRVEVEFGQGGYMLKWVGRDSQRVKLGWRKTTCRPDQVAEKLGSYFARVREVFLANLPAASRELAVRRGMVSESRESAVNEKGGARGAAVGPMLEFADTTDVPEIAALLKSDVDDAGVVSALVKMGASDREAGKVVKQRGYFTGGGYDADMARLARAKGDKQLHEKIAKFFAAGVLKYIGPKKMAEVVERNKTYGAGVCASHDFCDANVFMEAAMKKGGFDSDDWRDFAALNDWSDLWGAAWDVAKENQFFFRG